MYPVVLWPQHRGSTPRSQNGSRRKCFSFCEIPFRSPFPLLSSISRIQDFNIRK